MVTGVRFHSRHSHHVPNKPKYEPTEGLTGIYYCGRKVLKC